MSDEEEVAVFDEEYVPEEADVPLYPDITMKLPDPSDEPHLIIARGRVALRPHSARDADAFMYEILVDDGKSYEDTIRDWFTVDA